MAIKDLLRPCIQDLDLKDVEFQPTMPHRLQLIP